MEPTELVAAKSKKELLNHLKSQDITIPERIQGATSQHYEKWGAFRLLATLAVDDRLEYPVTLTHRDKPDFHLELPDQDVGLEFTEAVSQEEAAIDAQAQHMGKSVVLFADQFKKDMPRRTAAERRRIIEDPPPGGVGWGDDRGVPEWIEWMLDPIRKKIIAFAKPGFVKYAENWLLIHDDSPTLCGRNVRDRWVQLEMELKHHFSQTLCYDVIFIESDNELARFTEKEFTVSTLVDLWK
jgi:hypothetical protein